MGNLKNIKRLATSLFSFAVENGKLNFISDNMTNNTLEVAYPSPAPDFRAAATVGVQGIETFFIGEVFSALQPKGQVELK